jgi:SAM-dependent methyltransferase
VKKLTRLHLETFLKKYRSEKRVLDIGSGGSSYGRFFPNRLTVDIDPLRKPEIVADVHQLPFKDEEFEMILCTEVLEHTIDPARAIKEMMRVLKKGGILVLSTRFVFPLHDIPNDHWRFTKYNLERLFSEWEILELTPEMRTFSSIAALLQRIIFQTKLRGNKLTKGILYLLVLFFSKLDFLIVEEYGDIKRETVTSDIISTGYYLAVKK